MSEDSSASSKKTSNNPDNQPLAEQSQSTPVESNMETTGPQLGGLDSNVESAQSVPKEETDSKQVETQVQQTPNKSVKLSGKSAKKIIFGFLGVIVLAGLGFGGWWAYGEFFVKSDSSQVEQPADFVNELEQAELNTEMPVAEIPDQPELIEPIESEEQVVSEPEDIVESEITEEASSYVFTGSSVSEEGERELTGTITEYSQSNYYDLSIKQTFRTQEQLSEEAFTGYFSMLAVFGYIDPQVILYEQNPTMQDLIANYYAPEDTSLIFSGFMLSNPEEMLSDLYNISPELKQNMERLKNQDTYLRNLNFSISLIASEQVYNVVDYFYDDSLKSFSLSVLEPDGTLTQENLDLSMFEKIPEDQKLTEENLDNSINDIQRISDIKVIQQAMRFYFNDQNSYPYVPDGVWLDDSWMLCQDGGFIPQEIGCNGTNYLNAIPLDPDTPVQSYFYISSTTADYIIAFNIKTAQEQVKAGLNLATPQGIVKDPLWTYPVANARLSEVGVEESIQTDIDADGLFDYDEILKWQTNIFNPDTDGDGYSDGEEVNGGYNPLGEGMIIN